MGRVLNLMVSEGATVIRGRLLSTNKPDIPPWKRSLPLSEVVQGHAPRRAGRSSVLGHGFRVLFSFVYART